MILTATTHSVTETSATHPPPTPQPTPPPPLPYLYYLICVNRESTQQRIFFVSHDRDLAERVLTYLRETYPSSDRIMQFLTQSERFPILCLQIIDDDEIKKKISEARVRYDFIYLRPIVLNGQDYSGIINDMWPSRCRIRTDLSNNDII
jgi:hypothetical protein